MPAEALFRALFLAFLGRVLVIADYGQIELRTGCLIAACRAMQEVFATGMDIHSATAERIHHITYDPANPQHVKWRKAGKPVTFAVTYGAMARTIALNSGLSIPEAEELLDSWLRAYPGFRTYRDEQPDKARALGYIELASGQRIAIAEDARAPQLINAPVQGGSASVMYLAATLIYNDLKERGLDARLAALVHDEVIVDSAPEDAEEVKEIIETRMREALLDLFPEAAAMKADNIADAAIVKDWSEKP